VAAGATLGYTVAASAVVGGGLEAGQAAIEGRSGLEIAVCGGVGAFSTAVGTVAGGAAAGASSGLTSELINGAVSSGMSGVIDTYGIDSTKAIIDEEKERMHNIEIETIKLQNERQ
jgi:hypothetical protein